jgi:motility quorum-sensing regulator / GCU-specific mRNA interferase toxin
LEKRTPHCPLSIVKTLIDAGKVRTTRSAREGAVAMGLGFEDMLLIVKRLTGADFHKSMTTHGDHRVWQDVYRCATLVGTAYIKLTVVDDLLIVSFKEL